MDKMVRRAVSLGMAGVIFYVAHTILGNFLWPEYDPVTMDISSLTADGAPDAALLRSLSAAYSICMVIMAAALAVIAFHRHRHWVRSGFLLLLVMQVTSAVGYSLFPLTSDKTQLNFQNTMHLIITGVVVFTTIVSSFLIAFGYLKQEKRKRLGKTSLTFAVLITLFGMANPISMAMELNILGLTERLVIYTIQSFLFVLSYHYTFREEAPLIRRAGRIRQV